MVRRPGPLQALRGSALTVIGADLPPALVPLAWLVGVWEGDGVVGYPTMDGDRPFAQRVDVSHDGRGFLLWHAVSWQLGPDGERGEPDATEVGYWRVTGDAPEGPGVEVELLLAHPTGILEMYEGRAANGRIDLATDVVIRSPHAQEYTAAKRLYGLVEGDLLWAMDVAALGHPLTPRASARLHRVS